MPLTTGFTSRTAAKGEGHIHSEKWHRCLGHVRGKSGEKYNPYAVCTHSIGYTGSVNPEHRTPGPHKSADTRRFKKSAKRRREAKEQAEKHDISFASVLKFDAAKKKKKVKEVLTSDEHTGSCDPKTGEPTKRSTFS